MMARVRPISYKLARSSTREKQLATAQEWAEKWHADMIDIIKRVSDNAGKDWEAFDKAIVDLRRVTHRKHDALQNVLRTLTEPLYTDDLKD